jgi:V/A-type H+-transporting ATPase subunit E
MLKIASKWCEQESIKIETADADSLKAYFAKNAKQLLDGKVEIKQVNGNPANFTVSPSDGSYKVNFGEAEFENYFKSFLRPQLIDLLF